MKDLNFIARIAKSISVCMLFILFYANGFAQNKCTVKGRILDSLDHQPLNLSTVVVTNKADSSVLSYTVSDKSGRFTLTNLPLGKTLYFHLSYAGHQSISKEIKFIKEETIDLGNLILSTKMLDQVNILASRPPILIRHDTIEFNTQYFKTRPNAIVEELLKKLPGIQVDIDGSIYINGKQVRKILLDGREFFGSNPKVSSKNLEANMIDKVLVYDDRETDPDHLIRESSVSKIIDLKFKKAYKSGLFGKVDAGIGTKKRYQLGGLVNLFRDTLQISLLGLSNNLNTAVFNSNDLYSIGGFGRGGSDALDNKSLITGGNVFNSIETVTSTGFNLNNDYGKTLKLNLTYYYSTASDLYHSTSVQQQFLNDTVLMSNSNMDQKEITSQHSLNGLIKWNPNKNTQIRYTPSFIYANNSERNISSGQMYSNFNPRINSNNGDINQKVEKVAFNHSFFFYKSLNTPGSSLTINHYLAFNPGTINNNFNYSSLISFLPVNPSDTTDYYAHSNDHSINASLNMVYRRSLTKKLTADLAIGGNYNNSEQVLSTYEKNNNSGAYDLLLTDQSNDLTRIQWTTTARPELTYNLNQSWSIISNLSIESQYFDNTFNKNIGVLKQNYFYVLPSVELRSDALSVSYNKQVSYPSIYQLQPLTLIYSPLVQFTGNPLLKPFTSENVDVRYYDYIQTKDLGINAYTTLSLSKDPIVLKQSVNETGKTITTPINADGTQNWNMSFGGSISKRLKKTSDFQISLTTNLNGNFQKNIFVINNSGTTENFYFKIRQTFNINWKDKIEYAPSYSINKTFTSYSYNLYPYNNTTTQNFVNKLTYRLTKKITIEGVHSYLYNSNFNKSFANNINILDLSLSCQIQKKDRGNIRIAVYDLFNQNTSVLRYTYENKIISSENRILNRYFLLTYSFRINK